MSAPEHKSIAGFSVERPVTVLMTLLALLVLGVIAYTRIPIALFPEGHERQSLVVFVQVPNATPADVEQNVVRPIEEIIGTIPGVATVDSRARSGNCFVRVEFQNGTDLDTAYAELRDRMDRVMPDMPEEVERINVRGFDEGDIAVVEIAVSLPPDLEAPQVAMDTYVRPAIQRIDGVGNVEVFGLRTKEVIAELDAERVAAHGIDMNQVMGRLRGQDANLPGGWVLEGGRKFYVRSLGRYTDVDEVRNLVVDPERGLRLRDLATVEYREPDRDRHYRIDGQPRIGIEVLGTAGGNIVNISRDVRAALEELQELPQLSGIRFEVFFDQGQEVQESIDNLRNSMFWGGGFAAVVLFIFLRAPRMTGIIALAIPLSLLSTVIALYFVGWTLNMATMAGLLLSLGLVVDNSIVIVENIYRKRQEGVEARKAAITGTGEVGLAVVMATLTTIVVFLPLILMGGDQDFSFWMLRLGIPVVVSLIASLFIALIFIPLATLKLSRGTKHEDLRIVSWFRRRYLRALDWTLHHRIEATIFILLAMASIVIPMQNVETSDRGGRGEDTVRFFFEMPTGQTLEQASEFMSRIEEQIMSRKEEYGIARLESRFQRDNGRIYIIRETGESPEWYAVVWRSVARALNLEPPAKTRQMIEMELRQSLEIPAGYALRSWGGGGGGGNSNPSASTSVSLYGEDTETLMVLAQEVERRLRMIPEVYEVETDLQRGSDELQIRLDREQARRLGVEPQDISRNISYTLRGATLSQFRTPDGREVDISLELADAENTGLSDVRRMTFRNDQGEMVPLESVASLYVHRTLGQIRRENRETTMRVEASALQQDAQQLYAAIDDVMADFQMPQGYRWDKGTRWFRMQESGNARIFAAILAICFVFFLMGVLFESFLLPVAVIISVPFAFLGVYWTLYLTNTTLNMMAGIGIVVLIGVVVNNAIVLVDLVNRLRHEGMERFAALTTAARHRFRPILMTTFTTGCGLIPMALGDARMGDMPSAPLGRVMMGGLITSMFLTLIIVPLFYTYLDDLRGFFLRVMASMVSRPVGSGTAGMAGARSQRAEL